jgi:hypothetical protein
MTHLRLVPRLSIEWSSNSTFLLFHDVRFKRKNSRAVLYDKPYALEQCFSTAGPRPSTGPGRQFYRALVL